MRLSPILRTLRNHPSGLLLVGQLLAVLLNPLLEGTRAGRPASMVFGNVVLALALWVVFRSPLVSWIGWVLALPRQMRKNGQDKGHRTSLKEAGRTKAAGVSIVRRDSLTRTKAVLNAALRVWELKQRIRPEESAH